MVPKLSHLFYVLGGLNVADWITTLAGLEVGMEETHPVSAKLLEEGTFSEVKAAMTGGFLLSGLAISYVEKEYMPQAEYPITLGWNIMYAIMAAVVMLYVIVVVNNLIWIYFLSEGAA